MLRSEIMALKLAPGSFIDKAEISATLNMSRQPLSTALLRLAQEGFVEILPQRGTYVTRLKLPDILESLFIRTGLEANAVREMAVRRDRPTLEAVARNLDQQAEALATARLERLIDLDLDFHRLLSRGLGFVRLAQLIESGLVTLSRTAALLTPTQANLTDGYRQHRQIYDEIVAGAPNRAADLMVEHIGEFTQAVRARAAAEPELFSA